MKKIKLRTKIEACIGISLLLLISSYSGWSITRTITDQSDDVDTFIRNSNGNYWEATGNNIQTAINDLDNNSGTVWLPGNTIIDPGTTITMGENVRLDMQGCTLKPTSGSYNIIYMRENAQVSNGFIDCSNIALQNNHAAIYIDGIEQIGYGSTGIFNMKLKSKNSQGNGIFFNSTRTNIPDYCYQTMWITCDNIETYWFKYALHISASGGQQGLYNHSFVSGNIFSNWKSARDQWAIYIERPDTTNREDRNNSVNGNQFTNFQVETFSNGQGNIYCDGRYNQFRIFSWDWNNSGHQAGYNLYEFTELSDYNHILCYGEQEYIVDNGFGNMITNMYEGSITARKLSSPQGKPLLLNYQNDDDIYMFYNDQDETPTRNLRIYGNSAAVNNDYLSLSMQKTGGGTPYGLITTVNGFDMTLFASGILNLQGNDDLKINALGDDVEIFSAEDTKIYANDDIHITADYNNGGGGAVKINHLKLNTAFEPGHIPEEGSMYFNTANDTLAVYNGEQWLYFDHL